MSDITSDMMSTNVDSNLENTVDTEFSNDTLETLETIFTRDSLNILDTDDTFEPGGVTENTLDLIGMSDSSHTWDTLNTGIGASEDTDDYYLFDTSWDSSGEGGENLNEFPIFNASNSRPEDLTQEQIGNSLYFDQNV